MERALLWLRLQLPRNCDRNSWMSHDIGNLPLLCRNSPDVEAESTPTASTSPSIFPRSTCSSICSFGWRQGQLGQRRPSGSEEDGAYAPFTKSGTIAVNDVVASVYVDIQNENAGVLVVGGYETPLTMQFLAHVFQAPHRLACALRPSYCQTETYDDRGVSSWVAGPLAVAEWLIRQIMAVLNVGVCAKLFVGCCCLHCRNYDHERQVVAFGGHCVCRFRFQTSQEGSVTCL